MQMVQNCLMLLKYNITVYVGEVVFGQIYGMADQISVPLAAAGQ